MGGRRHGIFRKKRCLFPLDEKDEDSEKWRGVKCWP